MSGSVTYVTWTYNASSAIAKTANINTNGTGSAYAFACQAATPSYYKAVLSFDKNRTTSVFPSYTTSFQLTKEFWDVYTTDCQKVVHAHGTTPLSTSVYFNATVFTNYTSTAGSEYAGPSPSCLIRPDDCKVLKSSFSKESSSFNKFISSYTPPFYVVNPPTPPECSTVCTASQMCMIRGDHVRLIYWPVTTTGANSCRSNGTTVTPTETGIRTFESLGTTFTSPSVYISFQSLSAWDWGCNTEIGEGISNTIIGLPPQSLSSAVGWHLGRKPASYNLADLNGYVSSAAYFQMQQYDWGAARDTIIDELYFPTIWMPNEVLTFRPEWKNCDLSVFGINDPPIALTTVADLTSEAPKATSKPNTATPAASLSKPDAPKTIATAIQDQDTSATKGKDSTKGNTPATKSVSSDSPPPATSTGNVGDYIASALGYSKPSSPNSGAQSASESSPVTITTTTVKIVSIATNGFVLGTKTMSVSALLADGSKQRSTSVKGISIGTQGVVRGGSTIPLTSFLASPMTAKYQAHTDKSGSTFVVVAGSSVYAGSALTVGGHTVSVEDSCIVVDGTRTVSYLSRYAIGSGSAKASSIPYEVMATTDSAGHTVVVVGNETMSISGSAMTIDGHTISAGPSGVVVDGNRTTIRYASVTSTSANSTTSSSIPSIFFSTNSASPATTSSTLSSSALHLHTWSWSILYIIFGIVYVLR
jgi:hypothetical protein